jgi:HAD superfamily hydrolase (TIGR01549 family)
MELEQNTILFDLDGVIVNSENVWLMSLNEALKYYKQKEINSNIFNKKFWGNDVNNTLELLGLPKKALDIVNKAYLKNIDSVEIFPDVVKTLKCLSHFNKGVITNTPKKIALSLLNKFDILKYFNIVVTSDDVKYGKPNPEIIIKACKLLNVQTNEVIIIGDTINDIIAGKNLDCKVIGINIKADYTVNKLSKILDILFH